VNAVRCGDVDLAHVSSSAQKGEDFVAAVVVVVVVAQ
jgi:hypothetical protein